MFRTTIRVPNGLGPDTCKNWRSVGSDLGPNCLQRLSADDKKSKTRSLLFILRVLFEISNAIVEIKHNFPLFVLHFKSDFVLNGFSNKIKGAKAVNLSINLNPSRHLWATSRENGVLRIVWLYVEKCGFFKKATILIRKLGCCLHLEEYTQYEPRHVIPNNVAFWQV